MIGPLLATGAMGVAGLPVAGSGALRNIGQWMIGIALAGVELANFLWALFVGWIRSQGLRRARTKPLNTKKAATL